MHMRMAIALAGCIGALLLAAPASAAPLGPTGIAAAKEHVGQSLVEEIRHRRWRNHGYRHRPRLRFYYGPAYPYYRPYYYPYRYRYYDPYDYPYYGPYRRRHGMSLYFHF